MLFRSVAGKNQRSKVHVTFEGKPICGYRPGKKMSFQWCASHLHLPYIECANCLERAQRILIASNKVLQPTVGMRLQKLLSNRKATSVKPAGSHNSG